MIPSLVKESSVERRAVLLGMGLGFSRFLITMGVLAVVGWSYTVWGSAESPLRHLLRPGMALMILGVLSEQIVLVWIRRATTLERQGSYLFSEDTIERLAVGEEEGEHRD